MTTFDQRENAFEAKLAHDEELKFKAVARRNKWLGLWAAEKLGKSGVEAENYADALVSAALKEGDGSKVSALIRADFTRAGVQQSDHQIERKSNELLAQAIEEIKKEG